MNSVGPAASLVVRRSLFGSVPCLTLTSMTLHNRNSTSLIKEPVFHHRCFATKPRSRTYYYDILGVSPKATIVEIKSAYYKLSKVYHPDMNKKNEKSNLFTEINEAYEILGNTKTRRKYDHGIFPKNEPLSGDHDYTQSFQQRAGFGFDRQGPPTGRTGTYNFDEFYRQHYGNAVKNERAEREYRMELEHNARSAETERKLRVIVTSSVIVSLIVMFFLS